VSDPTATEPPAAAPAPVDAARWRRLHPLSPLLRGGLAVAAAGAWLVSNQVDAWLGADSQLPDGRPLLWLGLAAGLGLLALVAGSWLSWRVSRFRIGPSTLEVRTGLVLRQHRQVRYDRIQAVDLRRPLLARLAGLSEVHVQAAGSGRDARLSFLPHPEATEVRRTLMALAGRGDERDALVAQASDGPAAAAGLATAEARRTSAHREPGQEAPAARRPDGETVARVPAERLVQAWLLRGRTLGLAVAVPVLLWGLATGRGGVVATVGPALLAIGGNAAKELVREWNFHLRRDTDGIHVTRGLTELTSSSVPVHRIQALALRQPLPWRLADWWRIEANVAGVGTEHGEDDSVLLPVGTRVEALSTLSVVRPAGDLPAVRGGLGGADGTARQHRPHADDPAGHAAYVTVPARAAWLSPLVRQRHGYAVTDTALVVRGGRLRRWVEVVPHARVQSLRLRQGPVERRLRLATVELLTTSGPARPRVCHLDLAEATRLLNEQVGRSGRARERVH
jgi:putative membrane protein